MRKAMFFAFFFASYSAFAETKCTETIPVGSWVECVNAENILLDAELNKVYSQVISQLSQADLSEADKVKTKKSLISTQRAWLRFRQMDCDTLYTFNGGGDASKEEYLLCMQEHLERRIKDLKEYIYEP